MEDGALDQRTTRLHHQGAVSHNRQAAIAEGTQRDLLCAPQQTGEERAIGSGIPEVPYKPDERIP
jgi:hypothetical protein